MIQPTIGRVVWFWPAKGEAENFGLSGSLHPPTPLQLAAQRWPNRRADPLREVQTARRAIALIGALRLELIATFRAKQIVHEACIS
jgi:hypothetical protein